MKTCLLVIDVQASFTQRPYFASGSAVALASYLHAQNALIDGCQAQGVPIVRVFHVSPEADATDPFAPASGLVRPLEGLHGFDAAHELRKTRHSALVGTDLETWLRQQGIERVVVSGIRTEQCCETTTRQLSDLGWQVVFVPEATLTWDMQTLDGRLLPAAQIRERTVAVLHQRFARIAGVGQALDLAQPA